MKTVFTYKNYSFGRGNIDFIGILNSVGFCMTLYKLDNVVLRSGSEKTANASKSLEAERKKDLSPA